jgi:predicted XRE-type DNA-binding protein
MPKFPNETELKEIRKQTSRTRGSQGLSPDAGPLDRAKYEVCEQLLVFMKKKKLNQRQLADLLDAPETRVSEIIHYRIDKFTLDRLIAYLQVVKPMLTVHLA